MYLFDLAGTPGQYSPSIVLAAHIAEGYKTFEYRLCVEDSLQYFEYMYPNPDSKDPNAPPRVMRKYNLKDNPLGLEVTKHRVLPGFRILRFTYDPELYMQFYTDSNPLVVKPWMYINLLNRLTLKSEGGRIFEAHYTADDSEGVFRGDNTDMASTPKLAPGAYIQITGTMADDNAKVTFVMSQRGRPHMKPQTLYPVSLPEVEDDIPVTFVVKYYDGYILLDSGKETRTWKHDYKNPARFAVWNFNTTNIEMITSPGLE